MILYTFFKRTLTTTIAVLATILPSAYAQAATFTETQDAGQTLSTAQDLTSLSLNSISGRVFGDADLFQIFLTGGRTFSATTTSPDTAGIPIDDGLGIPTDLLVDPQLFLFDSSGQGVYANDDSFGSTQATLPSQGFSPDKSGFYYLAISTSGYDPVSNLGKIFPDEPFDQVFGPTGPGGGAPLLNFAGRSNISWRYDIALTGVQPVPEPTSTLGILALSAWGAVSILKKRNKQK